MEIGSAHVSAPPTSTHTPPPSRSCQQLLAMKACSSEAVAPAALGSFLFLASYLNINDPDWILWSSAYGLGGVICGWTVLLQGLNAETETTGGKDSSMIRRSVVIGGVAQAESTNF